MKKYEQADLYTYRIEWSNENEAHIGKCLEFPSLQAQGDSAETALKEITYLIKETIDWMVAEKEPVPEPFSSKSYKGNLTLRVSPEVHRRLALEAIEAGVSINQYIISKLF